MKTVNQIKAQFLRIQQATYNAPYVSNYEFQRRIYRLKKASSICDRYIRNIALYLAPSRRYGCIEREVFYRKLDEPVCREIYAKKKDVPLAQKIVEMIAAEERISAINNIGYELSPEDVHFAEEQLKKEL